MTREYSTSSDLKNKIVAMKKNQKNQVEKRDPSSNQNIYTRLVT